MAKQPSFQFYPGDWLKDPDLSICSIFARGLLIDLLAHMFEANQRGCLVSASGKPWSKDQIYRAVGRGESQEKVFAGLQELEDNGVLKRHESGYLYSARMVRDEEIREARRVSGSKGGSKTQANHQANSQANHQAKSRSSSSSSSSSSDKEKNNKKKEDPYTSGFETFWGSYPRRVAKKKAFQSWKTALVDCLDSQKKHEDESAEDFLIRRASDFASQVSDKDAEFVCHPTTWLNQGRWDDELGSRVATDDELRNWRP